MSKTESKFENKAFQKSSSPGIGFNLVTQTSNFDSIFATKPLEALESNLIEKLLTDNFQPGTISEEQLEEDLGQLKRITAEIKAIGKQGIILMGERIHRGSEILKPYRDGTFTKWLDATFGTRKTGYNMLNYYVLYKELPDDLRLQFKKIPHRAAYILASRKVGNVEDKVEIIRKYHDRSHKELVSLIQENLPLEIADKRMKKNYNQNILDSLREGIEKMVVRKKELNNYDKLAIASLIKMLNSLVDHESM